MAILTRLAVTRIDVGLEKSSFVVMSICMYRAERHSIFIAELLRHDFPSLVWDCEFEEYK